MGTWRRPKGSYTRSTPDFFLDSAASVGGYFAPKAVSTGVFIDLFNNATDGTVLHVYNVWVFNDGFQVWTFKTVHGHGGQFLQNAAPVVAGNPTPWGACYYDTFTNLISGSPTDTPISADYVGGDDTGANNEYAAMGPLKALRPGYSLRVQNLGANQPPATSAGSLIAVSFYFVALPDTG